LAAPVHDDSRGLYIVEAEKTVALTYNEPNGNKIEVSTCF